jgi:hypothetical protein
MPTSSRRLRWTRDFARRFGAFGVLAPFIAARRARRHLVARRPDAQEIGKPWRPGASRRMCSTVVWHGTQIALSDSRLAGAYGPRAYGNLFDASDRSFHLLLTPSRDAAAVAASCQRRAMSIDPMVALASLRTSGRLGKRPLS